MRHILISFVLFYLRFFAKLALFLNSPKAIIAVTGTVGKSSTRDALYAVFKDTVPTYKVRGNSETGIPASILGVTMQGYTALDWFFVLLRIPFHIFNLKGVDTLIVEMGIDDPYPPRNMEYLLSIVKPHIAIVLNIGAGHTMQFEKVLTEQQKNTMNEQERFDFLLDKIAQEKTKIITKSQCRIGIYNKDDTRIEKQIKKHTLTAQLLTFGKEKTCTISYKEYKNSLSGTSFSFVVKDKGEITLSFLKKLLPCEYQQSFAAAILAGVTCELSLEQIKQGLEKNFSISQGKSSMFKGIHDTTIIDGSYNASRPAVEAFLDLVEELKKQTKKEVVFLFGDMRELGEEAKAEHEKVVGKLKGVVDYLYCVGPLTLEYVIPQFDTHDLKEVRWFENAIRAGEYLKENLPKNAIVLVKGSQNNIFLEEAIKYILKDKDDEKNLCRQHPFWLKKKKKYFS